MTKEFILGGDLDKNIEGFWRLRKQKNIKMCIEVLDWVKEMNSIWF